MKVYISADMEGITGVSLWSETHKGEAGYERSREQMTKEVVAALEGALEGGADELFVKDAHEDGKNLISESLPKEARFVSGWSNHPYSMVEGLDESFDAVMFIGYHSAGGTNGSPLAHTLFPDRIRSIKLNGEKADEFLIFAHAAYHIGVPVVAVSGDGELIRHVRQFDSEIKTVAVQEGFGNATVSIHPELSINRIRKMAKKALENLDLYQLKIPDSYEILIEFNQHQDAYKYSFYPDAEQVGEYVIRYVTKDYMQILTLLNFL